jgi:hypothetical protein
MYKQKSEIIGQIQSYHNQVARLYYEIYEKAEDIEIKTLLFDLYMHEKDREDYLMRHRKIAEAINCWLDFPCDKLSNQITECFKDNINTGSEMTISDLIKIELYFDDCLIKLYNILSSENALSETVANIFYYMLKKTKKEQTLLADMLYKSKDNLYHKLSA